MKNYKRLTLPPCEIEDLPFVDLVVISHNHYDHLSYPTMRRIQKKFPEAHFFAPLGNKKWFESSSLPKGKATELDWWETKHVKLEAVKQMTGKRDSMSVLSSDNNNNNNNSTAGGITAIIGALPSQHTSARSGLDKNATLWASWSVESGGSKVYFAG